MLYHLLLAHIAAHSVAICIQDTKTGKLFLARMLTPCRRTVARASARLSVNRHALILVLSLSKGGLSVPMPWFDGLTTGVGARWPGQPESEKL
jgi:hypothetical protein